MASELGRGAQVRLDGDERKYARGGTSLRLIDNIREKLELEAGGTVADGNSEDGSTGDGTAASDEILIPGGALDLWPVASAYASGTTAETAAAGRALQLPALSSQFQGPDQTPQFEVSWSPFATEYFRALGGQVGTGPTLLAWSETAANVTGALVGKGTGGCTVANGGGDLFAVVDDGAGTTHANILKVKPGGASVAPTLECTTYDAAINVPATRAILLKAGDVTMAKVTNPLAATSTDGWPELSNDGTSGFARLEFTGTRTTVNGFIRSRGTASSLALWCGNANALTLDRQGITAAPNGFQMRMAATGDPSVFRAIGETNSGMLIGPASGGTGTVKVERLETVSITADTGYSRQVPVTGFAITMTTGQLFLNPAANLADGAITLPASPIDGQKATIACTRTITALSWVGTTYGAPSTIDANTPVTFRYITGLAGWIRI